MNAMSIYRNPWSLFDDLVSIQDEFNRVFDEKSGWPRARRQAYPPVNVWVRDEDAIIDIELPGVDPKRVEVSVEGDLLRIRGEFMAAVEGATYHRRERPEGEFSRSVQLPFAAESGAVKASYRDGILRVSVPRAEAEKPRRIAIEAA